MEEHYACQRRGTCCHETGAGQESDATPGTGNQGTSLLTAVDLDSVIPVTSLAGEFSHCQQGVTLRRSSPRGRLLCLQLLL